MQTEDVRNGNASMHRRSFLNYFIGLSLFSFGGMAAYSFGKYLFPPGTVGAAVESEVLRIPLVEIPVGTAKIVRYQGEPTVVIRVSEKSLHALSAVCTHLGCIVKWEEAKASLVCPCHAAFFDVNGNVIGGPAPRPLQSYPVRVVQDEIIIGEA